MPSPIITPAGPLSKDGKTATAFTANQNVTWSTTGGVLSLVTVNSVTWTAPNQTGVFNLVATNGVDPPTTVVITVRAILPNYWQWQVQITEEKDVQIFTPIAGPEQTRSYGNGKPRHVWDLGDDDSSYENAQEIRAFWDYHYPGKLFDMIDPSVGERRTYTIASNLGWKENHADSYNWAMRIKEAYPYTVTLV